MADARWQRIVELFERAKPLPPEERAALLARECGPDEELRQEVEAMLAAQPARSFLEPPFEAAGPDLPTLEDERDFPRIEGFQIQRQLGRGGMGIVYLAFETNLKRDVALKTLAIGDEEHMESLLRFRNEALALGKLSHPTIVPIFRNGEVDGRPYIVMPYVEGPTLAQKLAATRTARLGRSPSPAEERERLRDAARIVALVADGLEHAHQQKIVHRDVKPSNIIIDPAGNPHITDFGIASSIDRTRITRTGQLGGTCRYMSPEQARAARDEIDGRSDVFSLGVVLYETLSLRVPFDGETVVQVLDAVVSKEPRRLRQIDANIPRDLEVICHKALEKAPRNRYQSAAHMAADLRSYLAGRPIMARPVSLPRRVARRAWAHRLACLSALLLSSLGLTIWLAAKPVDVPMAHLRVTGRAGGLRVIVQTFDAKELRFGAAEEAGTSPVEIARPPGLYWITVVRGDGAFAETTVNVTSSEGSRDIALNESLSGECPDDMVEIPAATHRLGSKTSDGRMMKPRARALPAFRIDRTEVTNAEYLAFAREHGLRLPSTWPDPYKSDYDDLPVAGIRREDAEAFARAKGKRLPTADEWEAAARWPDGRQWPWANVPDAEQMPDPPEKLPACSEPIRDDQGSQLTRLWLSSSVSVTSCADLATPAGLRHMLTNVCEFTASVDPDTPSTVVFKGGSWRPGSAIAGAAISWLQPAGMGSPEIGFRCARSLTPLFLDKESR